MLIGVTNQLKKAEQSREKKKAAGKELKAAKARKAAAPAPAAPAAKKSKATVLSKELVQEELQRLLVDEAEEAEANCTVDELLSALRKTHRAMTVEESALRAFLKVLDEDGVINIMLDIIEMALILSTDDDADDE